MEAQLKGEKTYFGQINDNKSMLLSEIEEAFRNRHPSKILDEMQSEIFKELDDNISHPKNKLEEVDGKLKKALEVIDTKIKEIIKEYNEKLKANSNDLGKDLFEIQKKMKYLFSMMHEGLNLHCDSIDAKEDVKEVDAVNVFGVSTAIGIFSGFTFSVGTALAVSWTVTASEFALLSLASTGVGALFAGAAAGLGYGIYRAVKHFTKEEDLMKACIKIKDKCRQNIDEQKKKLNSEYDNLKNSQVTNFNQQFNFYLERMSNQGGQNDLSNKLILL